MSPTTLPTAPRQQGLRGHHVLAAFLGFFATVILVNAAMIYSAVSTYSGLVANEPYRKGLHYNERIAASERQARLGWAETVEVGRDGSVALTLSEDGRPIRGLAVEAVLGRPSTNRHDIALRLVESAPGRYEAASSTLGEGSWLVSVAARWRPADEPVYRLRRRVWIKP